MIMTTPYYPMSPASIGNNTTSNSSSNNNSAYNTGTSTPVSNEYGTTITSSSNSNNNNSYHQRSNSSSNNHHHHQTKGSSIEMNSYSLEALLQEPGALSHQKQVTINNMKQLALEHYHLFIDNFKKFNQTNIQMTTINSSIDVLVDHLPAISKNCESFSVMSQAMTGKRSANKTLLDNFPTILDLLEVPQLMDTCVKSASYEEALQLEAFSKKIAKQYPNIKIVNEIVSEIATITQTLISNLQQSLRSNISLTDSIKIVGLLRRLGVYKENELKTILLYSRDQWLMNTIKLISDPNPVTFLTKLTDCCRTNLFDIVTQFNAIFSDDSDDDTNIDDFILYGWIELKISHYLTTLETTLPLIKEGSGIAYILENAMYYSSSMSRVGVDFRPLLAPLFERTITNFLISKSATATHHFLESLKSFKFQQQPSNPASSSSPSSSSIVQIPPPSILRYLPLAVLTNSFISTFIELKECIPVSIEYQLVSILKDTLLQITSGIYSFYIQQQSSSSSSSSSSTSSSSTVIIAPLSIPLSQNPVFQNFCKCIVEDFLPFIVRCFDLIINNKSGTSSIDISGFTTSLIKLYNSNPTTVVPTAPTVPTVPITSEPTTPTLPNTINRSVMNGKLQPVVVIPPVTEQLPSPPVPTITTTTPIVESIINESISETIKPSGSLPMESNSSIVQDTPISHSGDNTIVLENKEIIIQHQPPIKENQETNPTEIIKEEEKEEEIIIKTEQKDNDAQNNNIISSQQSEEPSNNNIIIDDESIQQPPTL
ncbi:oligomeric Golgi complex component [Cavenderia fasciculata]|uniref:Conserved oligomeric Golgi complex subunit 8 n=1 Tax=Cavenderia fasciculata TaxID=261658 RepID=F4PMU1_CACFS|nr:oligomeric Golgi complex component [Cavenderia fasciculata]EGG23685.1 oligomeric Golgi complex component [Cavenderia fasciculata]|eukprot:XP_004361536.1 oligomeric Golgi complex component [Cavenderia fasciculata]